MARVHGLLTDPEKTAFLFVAMAETLPIALPPVHRSKASWERFVRPSTGWCAPSSPSTTRSPLGAHTQTRQRDPHRLTGRWDSLSAWPVSQQSATHLDHSAEVDSKQRLMRVGANRYAAMTESW